MTELLSEMVIAYWWYSSMHSLTTLHYVISTITVLTA